MGLIVAIDLSLSHLAFGAGHVVPLGDGIQFTIRMTLATVEQVLKTIPEILIYYGQAEPFNPDLIHVVMQTGRLAVGDLDDEPACGHRFDWQA